MPKRMAQRNVKALPSVLMFPKTIELEQRVSRAEVTVSELPEILAEKDAQIASLKSTVDMLHSRIVSLQAQLDHLLAKIGHY
jgi:uncharacterized coiled-coil protein SlyX